METGRKRGEKGVRGRKGEKGREREGIKEVRGVRKGERAVSEDKRG